MLRYQIDSALEFIFYDQTSMNVLMIMVVVNIVVTILWVIISVCVMKVMD